MPGMREAWLVFQEKVIAMAPPDTMAEYLAHMQGAFYAGGSTVILALAEDVPCRNLVEEIMFYAESTEDMSHTMRTALASLH